MSDDDARVEADPPEPLSHNRNFRLLWIGQILSDLGSQFGALAYPLLILVLTHSPVIAGVAGTVSSLVAFAVRLPAGALADRVDRRRVMIVTDGVRTTVLAGLSVAVLEHAIVWPVVLAVAIVDRVGDTIFTPSSTAALPFIVHDSQLEGAWAATEARQYGASLAGPAIGGALFNLGRAVPFIGDTISYGVSVVASRAMRGTFRTPPSGEPRRGLWSEAFEGLRVIWRDALLRAVIVQAPLINFAFNGVVFAVTLSLQHHGTSPAIIGLSQAGIGLGGLLGAVVAPKIQGRFSVRQLVLILTAGGTVFFLLAALIAPSPLMVIAIAVPFFVSPTTNAVLFAALLRETPEQLRGRVNNALLQVATALAALSPLAAGLLVAHTSASWTFVAFAATLAVSTVLCLTLKGLREAGSDRGGPRRAGS
ncbi:MAG: MFS transporter [Acidimicrobiales bacterium]